MKKDFAEIIKRLSERNIELKKENLLLQKEINEAHEKTLESINKCVNITKLNIELSKKVLTLQNISGVSFFNLKMNKKENNLDKLVTKINDIMGISTATDWEWFCKQTNTPPNIKEKNKKRGNGRGKKSE